MLFFKFHVKTWCYFYLMSPVLSARILGFFTLEARSHFNFHEEIVQSLLSVGHRVTVVAPFASKHSDHENYTIINSNIEKNDSSNPLSSIAGPSVGLPFFSKFLDALSVVRQECHNVLSLEDMNTLRNYDLMFVETILMYRCYLPIAEKLKIPVIGTLSLRSMINFDSSVGNTRFPSVLLNEWYFRNTKMAFSERVFNLAGEIELRMGCVLEERELNKFHVEHFPDQKPPTVRLSLVFVNDHPCLGARAMMPNSISIGGINVKSSSLKPIDEELKKFIKEAKHGVILFTLGSIIADDIINTEIMIILKNTFAKIPQRIIWKFSHQIEGLSENVLLRKWLPQKEILAHANVLAFISHCGLGSTYEAIYFGKPMILLPVWSDQPGNAGILSSLGVGVYVDWMELSELKLLDAINEVINDTKYRDNMANLSQKFKDEPTSPAEKVIFWTEYVLRHRGAFHLRATEADMPLYQILLLDVIIFLIFTITLSGYLFFFVTKNVTRVVLSKRYMKYIRVFYQLFQFQKPLVSDSKKKL